MSINLYIDAEWYLNQRIFLIGYAYEDTRTGTITVRQIFRKLIERKHIREMLQRVTGSIFVYGPDVAMIEKRFRIPLRKLYTCINFLKVVKHCVPALSSYKLADIEKHFGIHRRQDKYKKSIFDIWRDWHRPAMRSIVMEYNYEDVYHLARLKQIIFGKYHPSRQWLRSIALTAKAIAAMVSGCGAYLPRLVVVSLW